MVNVFQADFDDVLIAGTRKENPDDLEKVALHLVPGPIRSVSDFKKNMVSIEPKSGFLLSFQAGGTDFDPVVSSSLITGGEEVPLFQIGKHNGPPSFCTIFDDDIGEVTIEEDDGKTTVQDASFHRNCLAVWTRTVNNEEETGFEAIVFDNGEKIAEFDISRDDALRARTRVEKTDVGEDAGKLGGMMLQAA